MKIRFHMVAGEPIVVGNINLETAEGYVADAGKASQFIPLPVVDTRPHTYINPRNIVRIEFLADEDEKRSEPLRFK